MCIIPGTNFLFLNCRICVLDIGFFIVWGLLTVCLPSHLVSRCQFSTFEQCQEWLKRLNAVVHPPSRLEDLFSFAFHAWCMEVYAGEKEQHGELCRPGKTLSPMYPHSNPTGLSPLSWSYRTSLLSLQGNTWPRGSRMRWRGWVLTLRMLGGYLTSTASSGKTGFVCYLFQSLILTNNKSMDVKRVDGYYCTVLGRYCKWLKPGFTVCKQTFVEPSQPFNAPLSCLTLWPSALPGFAPATLSNSWCQHGSLTRSWRMWLPSAPGRGFLL